MAMKLRQLVEIKWETKGEVITGHLLKATPVKFRDGGTNVNYLVKRAIDGTIVAFPGSSQINKLLHTSDIGSLIEVKYVGTDAKAPAPGMSPTKIFEVSVDDGNKLAGGDPPPVENGITDDDFPF